MENELTPFDYGTVDAFEADRLKQHEAVILKSAKKMSDAAYEIGEELQAAHDELANHKNGTFFAWCESIGIKRTQAQDFMSYHDFICRNAVNKSKLESLPKRLIVDANRPSTPQELKDGVANGDITSLPQFKKLKAELEATKNVLRTTESKLTSAEQERDEAKTENVQLKANFSTAVSDKAFEIQGESVRAKKAAEQARDEAEAKAESFRAKADAYDDLQKTNHSLREKIRQQADELANRPNVETVVTKEVIPDEYKKALLENQQLKKELAAHRAHAQNMTVQELAQTDKEFDDLQKSYEEEERTSKRLEYFETLSSFFPEGQIEARELARCFLKFHGNEPAIVHTVQQNLRLAIDSMTWIYDALTAKPKLEVVK
ncbi:hypothetical protein [uncultured Selenomonas sp.]|uniref:hypothetical protein n=1 Tax=uncultured Selenomonas sp. TaxID=159275 RepID=UPI0025FCE13E|nr:hypothetical protein [uncultured Selenomonas sp.]